MLGILSKFLDANEREIKNLRTVVERANLFEAKIKKLSDPQLKNKALDLKKRYQKGISLDELLPEAFALVREASFRVNKERPYDVQLMASAALHLGKIAEQKTGEGKTLSAAPAVFLNSLTGKGVHIVTVNDYLARRDCGWMGPIYYMLGVSCATIIHDSALIYDPKFNNEKSSSAGKEAKSDKRLKHLRPISRKEAYQADVTYGTNNEFGFDYLRDNMALSLENQNQRGHYFAIVDEVDSILIDEARTPLIISAPDQEPTDKYIKFAKLITNLQKETDYVIDEKLRTAHLTEHGTLKIEKLLGVENLYEKDFSILHHIEEALKAHAIFQKDKDYVVKDGEVIIVDEFTGRLMPGRRYSEGLHQAIEAKEGVQIQQETKTLATISFQNYFRMYEKLAGMTGTAATEAEEFHKIYKLDVVVIPTNKPIKRTDHSDAIYKTQSAKYNAVAEEIKKINETGQPVLVGTTSIEKNEFLSDLLKRKGVSHAILNAKNHEKEAEIISEAGRKGAVTVATNLAGRGVDIKLGKGVEEVGGLYVIGTERHESRRIDNQLRGRSGRQGDPGATKFFVSLEDDLMRIFGGEQVAKVMGFLNIPEDMPIEHSLVSKAIESAQKKVEGHNFDSRKYTVEYDDVMNQQRQIIYKVRKQILEVASSKDKKNTILRDEILEKIAKEIQSVVTVNLETETLEIDFNKRLEKVVNEFATIIPFDDSSKQGLMEQLKQANSTDEIFAFLTKLSRELYEAREKHIGEETARQIEVFVYLNTLDTLWMEHLDTVDDLRAGIGLRAYAQRDPLVEYKREAFDLFERLMASIDSEIVHRVYKLGVEGQGPITASPVVDISNISEVHEEALDETNLLEEAGQLISGVDKLSENKKDSDTSVTKVIIEKDGQVVAENIYGGDGSLNRKKPGRNEPCWCGSGRKYKKCHYPN